MRNQPQTEKRGWGEGLGCRDVGARATQDPGHRAGDADVADDQATSAEVTATATTLLRTTIQHHIQLSAMADLKANIVITASSLVATLAASQIEDPGNRWAAVVLMLGAVTAVILAVLAVLPSSKTVTPRKGSSPSLLFFANFAALPEDEYVDLGQELLTDQRGMYDAQLRDLHRHGRYLATKKYRFLRLAYLSFLTGILGAVAVQVVQAIA